MKENKEYIERWTALNAIEEQADIDGDPKAVMRAWRVVKELPAAFVSADEAESEWVMDKNNFSLHCPICLYDVPVGTAEAIYCWDFCPSCGSKMGVKP